MRYGSRAQSSADMEVRLFGHRICCCERRHALCIDDVFVRSSVLDYMLLKAFFVARPGNLRHPKMSVPFLDVPGLAKQLCRGQQHKQIPDLLDSSEQRRKLIHQHVSRLRPKLWSFGLDIRYIRGLDGYCLLGLSQEPLSAPSS